MIKRKGFTLIELLVVIGIIALLSTLAVVALNNARQKARDVKRVADVKQIQTALELYFQDNNGYPVEGSAVTLGPTTGTDDCLDEDGLVAACDAGGTTYMGVVPAAPTPPSANIYTYTAASSSTYTINFTLEGDVGTLSGASTATPEGMQ